MYLTSLTSGKYPNSVFPIQNNKETKLNPKVKLAGQNKYDKTREREERLYKFQDLKEDAPSPALSHPVGF